jgi:superfamily II DNA or RNA helicase
MLKHDTGVLAATTAFGKTVVAAWLIAQRGVNTLVLVHRRQLLDQWVERLAAFLNLPVKSIGRIGGGRKKPTGVLDVAVIQSLVRKDVVNDCVADYGQVIVDECHHLSAHSFEQVVRRAKARFVLGLSATVTRKRSSSNHLHAMRLRAASSRRQSAGGGTTVRTHGHCSPNHVSDRQRHRCG